MPAPYQGRCLCGAVRYRVDREPLTLYACHCLDCQRRTGSAFALSMIVRRSSVEVLQGEPAAYFAALPDGRTKSGRMCAACGTRLWGEPRNAELLVIQPGTLEQPIGLVPVAHQWTSSAQPWTVFPQGAVLFETQPADRAEMMRLWRDAQEVRKSKGLE
jgi:hypothetical protein